MKTQPIKKQAAPGVQGPEAVAATSANRNNQGNYTLTLTNSTLRNRDQSNGWEAG